MVMGVGSPPGVARSGIFHASTVKVKVKGKVNVKGVAPQRTARVAPQR